MKPEAIKISDEAVEDINESFLWYEKQSPGLGFEFIKVLDSDFQYIASFAESFPIAFKEIRKMCAEKIPV